MSLLLFFRGSGIQPVSSFTAVSHALGSEIILEWLLPAILPTNYRIVIFKRRLSAPTDEEIAAYFTSGTIASGLSVILKSAGIEQHFDYACENGYAYYYAAYVEDTDNDTQSAGVSAHATPAFSATIGYLNVKDIVIEALKAILSNYDAVNVKDYDIRKDHTIIDARFPLITVLRQSSNDARRLWGNLLDDSDTSKMTYGRIVETNVQVIWGDVNANRRDVLSTIFETNEQQIIKYILNNSEANNVVTQIGGDVIDPRYPDKVVHAGEMYIRIMHPIYAYHPEDTNRRPYSSTTLV